MLRRWTRFGLATLALASGGTAVLAQQFGPAERQEVLAQVAALSAAEREDILTNMLPTLVATLDGQMPMRVDDITTATRVTYVPTVVEYAYQIDPGVDFGPGLMEDQKAILVQTMCNQNDTFLILALGVTLRYVYRGGKVDIGTLDLVLADCPAATPAK